MLPEARSGHSILVIDDQDATRYILRRILSQAGYRVLEAANGAAGLEKALQFPDIIIVDVNLPDMLGYEVCRRIRSNPVTSSIPMLQVSASFLSSESKVQALAGGADSYLTQPIEPAVLLAQVSALLRLRSAEALSSLSARQWQNTFDALSDGVALLDSAARVVRVNRSFLSLLELTTAEVEGRSIRQIFKERFQTDFQELTGGRGTQLTLRQSSEVRWFHVRLDTIEADPENESGSILIVTETTENKKLQETLKLSEKLATTGRLAHIIAHEINNPLEALSNLLYLAIGSTSPQDEAYEYMQQATTELDRISQITKQVLAYHRDSKQPVLIASSELLEAVLAMFRAQMLVSRIDLNFKARCDVALQVYPGEIRQVFTNLISNALDAVGPTGGQLRVRCNCATDEATQRKGVRFMFSDSGPGIPEHVLPNIFEAFYTTKETRGSGVGLWLSAEVVGKHRGKIRVRTRTEGAHRGSLFSIFLPCPKS